jgi:hypothetical protein
MTTPRKGCSSKPAAEPPPSPEVTITFGANDAFTGTLLCKVRLSDDSSDVLPPNLVSDTIIPLSEKPPRTHFHSVLERSSGGTLDLQTINVMLTAMKAGLVLQDGSDASIKYLFTPTSSKLATLSVVSTGSSSPTKRRMLDAMAKLSNKKQRAIELPEAMSKKVPEMSPIAWLHVIESDGNFRPISLPELRSSLEDSLSTATPTPQHFCTQLLPKAILGDMLPKCAAEITVSKRLLQEFLSGTVLLDDTSMYELVSTKTATNTEFLLRQVQIQALMRLQLYCMAPSVLLELTAKKLTKRAPKKEPKEVLLTQVTTVLSFSSFLLDSSQPFDVFLNDTIPLSLYCSMPELIAELFEFFEVPNPFLTKMAAVDSDDDDSLNVMVATPAKQKKADRVKFAEEIDDSSYTKAKSAKKKERQERKEQRKSVDEGSKSLFGEREEIEKSESTGVSKERRKERKERRKSGDGKSEAKSSRRKSGDGLSQLQEPEGDPCNPSMREGKASRVKSGDLPQQKSSSGEAFSLDARRKSVKEKSSRKSGDGLSLQKSSSGESTLESSLDFSGSSLLSAKKISLVKDAKPKYVGSHFGDSLSNHYVQAPVMPKPSVRSKSVERSRSVERCRSTERSRPKKATTGSSPSKHKYDRVDKSKSPSKLVQAGDALTLQSPEYTIRPTAKIVAETPAAAPSKFTASPGATKRQISFDMAEPRRPFTARTNVRASHQEALSSSNAAKGLLQEALAARMANRDKFESNYTSLR